MSAVGIAAALGFALIALAIYLKLFAGWRQAHQTTLGALTMLYGMWLALGTGTVLKLAVPGIGSIVLGTAAGTAVGFLTYLAIGVVGVATGGVGIAIGKLGMMFMGAAIAGLGAAAGGFGLVRVPLISPAFWAPVIVIGVYMLFGANQRKRLAQQANRVALPSPDASHGS